MNIKELLLQGQNFVTLLNQFHIDVNNLVIKDEETLFSTPYSSKKSHLQESVCLEGQNDSEKITMFGVIHLNFVSNLAVFELKDFEKLNLIKVE